MKRIILLRHAKSDEPKEGFPDFVRALNEKGIGNAKKIALRTKKRAIVPQLIVTSPANRAMETARIFADTLGYPTNQIVQNDQLYHDCDDRLFGGLLDGLDPQIESVMIVGHDPSMTNAARHLVRGFSESVPTCGIIVIDLKKDTWRSIGENDGELVLFDFPKKEAETYKQIEHDSASVIFDTLYGVLSKIDRQTAIDQKESIKDWADEIAEGFIRKIKKREKNH